MNEVWDLVRHSHEENEKLRNDVHKIAQSCLTTHRKKTVIECPPCYGRIVDRCKQRYLNTEEVEWFTGRKPFLKSIDTVLTGMKAYHKDRSKLRQVIRDEKRKYYIDKVRNTVIKATAEVSLGADTLAEMLGSRNFPLKDLIDQIRLALQRTVSMCVTPARLDEMLVALNDMAPMLCDERYFIYKEYFFGAQPNQPVAKNEEPYLVALELLPPNDMVDRLLGHAKTNAGLIEQRDKWKMRLEEMRRARAAHELQKTEKKLKAEAQAKALQELREARKQDMARKAERLELMRAERKQKAEARELRMAERKSRAEARSLRKAEARARRAKVHVPSSLKFLPSCSVCSQALKRENFYVCELCMVLTDLRVLRWPTAFCSDECYSKGHVCSPSLSRSPYCWQVSNIGSSLVICVRRSGITVPRATPAFSLISPGPTCGARPASPRSAKSVRTCTTGHPSSARRTVLRATSNCTAILSTLRSVTTATSPPWIFTRCSTAAATPRNTGQKTSWSTSGPSRRSGPRSSGGPA